MSSTASSTASMGMMILWMVVIFGVMYFLMIRPQKNCRIPMRKQAIAEVEKAEQASA